MEMKKSASMILLMVALSTAHAIDKAPKIKLQCRVPTTGFQIYNEGNTVKSHITHPYGARYTPIHRGTVTLALAQELGDKAAVLQALGNIQTFTWPREKCQLGPQMVFECTDGREVEINKHKIKPLFIKTAASTSMDLSGASNTLNFTVGLLVEDKPYTFTIDYSPEKHCQSTVPGRN